MELNWTTIGILVAVWLVGYLLGLLESAIKNEKKEVKISIEGEEAEKGKASTTPEIDELEPEALTIFERVSGALKLRIDGETVEYKSDLSPEQGKRLLALVMSLRPWIEGVKTAPPPAHLPADAKIPHSPPQPAPKVDLVRNPELDEFAFSNLTMTEQINSVLQKNLEGHSLKYRGISLGTAPDGGLLIRVGLDKYKAITEVPEQAIQDVLREAIADWEARVTPV